MKNLHRLFAVASAAFFIAGSALAQNAGTVSSHAFAVGKGPGTTGFTSLLCTSAQLAVGQSAADPICRTLTGDVTLNAAGVTAIGAGKVTNAMIAAMTSAQLAAILSDETGTGFAYFQGGALGTPSSATLTNATGLPTSGLVNNAVTNAKLATAGAFTLKGNATGATAAPTDIDVTALTAKASPVSADIVLIQDSAASNAFKKTTVGALSSAGSVASIAGNTGAFTLSTGLSNVGNDIRLALNNATLQVNPANPTGTSSTTPVMMGLGSTCKITPVYSSRVHLEIVIGTATVTAASTQLTTMLRQGTGTAPANATASTGTQVGNQAVTSLSISSNIPYAMSGLVTGLTPGTAVWFDLSVAISGGSASVSNISCNAYEL